VPAEHRALQDALLALPASYRRSLLLHDGLGLGLPTTAADTEASTAATIGRIAHGRAALAERLPLPPDAPPAWWGPVLGGSLRAFLASQPARTGRPGAIRRRWARRARAAALLHLLCVAGVVALLVRGLR
jgi:hypothetical protein